MVKELFEYVFNLLKSRMVPLVLVFVLLFSVLVSRLFTLQIINGESYKVDLDNSIKKTTSVAATRGRIFDKNGVLLAYNELAYAVKISDSGIYSSNEVKHATVNKSISETLKIIEQKGDVFSNSFQVTVSDSDKYEYTVSGNSRLRFLRDTLGKPTTGDLSDEEKSYTAEQLIDVLCQRYALDKTLYPKRHVVEILYLRTMMSANSYNRYMTFTIAEEVSDETVAAILESSGSLVGVTVEEQYIRKYVDSLYCSQILGYTGAVSSTELEDLKAIDPTYENNDSVGKGGIEKALEQELSGVKGSKTVYVDTVGRITEVIDETESTAGNDVYLTIDIQLQKKLYYAIEDKLVQILLNNITTDKKYAYDGSEISYVYIPQKEVYFALIDNNILPLKKLAESQGESTKSVYNAFLKQFTTTKEWLKKELYTSPTAYSKLSDVNRELIWYIYKDILRAYDIFLGSNVDTSDSYYQQWINGGSLSLEEFLKYSITKNWIDMSALTNQQYVSLQESYDILVEYIFEMIEDDSNFHKKVYSLLIEKGTISGKQICLSLYELGVLVQDDNYTALKNGRISSYQFIRNVIEQKLITPAQLALQPCSGAVVMINPNNGNVEALVSYPSYDNNMLSGTVDPTYYKQLLMDKSKPLYNWATQSQCAPGSTFKICSAIAGLDMGLIDSKTTEVCTGVFTKVTPNPRCHNRSGHGSVNVATAIMHSCNIYFYNVAFKLAYSKTASFSHDVGTDILKSYAEKLGLATLSGIEIEETAPHPSDENVISSAIGQGTNNYSALNLARYTATLANSGTCFNVTLVDKITTNDGTVVKDNSATVANKVEVASSTWNSVHYGMELAAKSYYQLNQYALSSGRTFGAKTGTAQERLDESNHGIFISYTPAKNPEIAAAVLIPHGYGSGNAQELTVDMYNIYYGTDEE